MEKKEYEINVDPSILELLGPSLYTNIYYVLSELIANAYDADARNVYILDKGTQIIVEDDGSGMSYNNGDVKNYLHVARVSRTNDENAITNGFKRLKMGRKGIGKLAALSVSERVIVKTKTKEGERSGFVLSRIVADSRRLEALPDSEIMFEKIFEHGTSIVMTNPQYSLHKTLSVIKKNLLKIFPVVSADFKIHIETKNGCEILENFDAEIMKDLCSIIVLGGNDFSRLAANVWASNVPIWVEGHREKLVKNIGASIIPVEMFDKNGEKFVCDMEIKGWIGTYETTRGRKKDIIDFPDNFISLFANGKMGEFNILPLIGQNKLTEVYVVGQLHIDLFEQTTLPDMALSNRQGYKSDDPRYIKATEYIRDKLLSEILNMRKQYSKFKEDGKERKKLEQKAIKEVVLTEKINEFDKVFISRYRKKLCDTIGYNEKDTLPSSLESSATDALNEVKKLIGLKCEVDANKKRILISHTSDDKIVANVVYEMLMYNGVPKEDILYSSGDLESALPCGVDIYEYLRDFFVNSSSVEKFFVFFITSKKMSQSWGALCELGAAWITQAEHQIVNIPNFTPVPPLHSPQLWFTINRSQKKELSISRLGIEQFCKRIADVCTNLGYKCAGHTQNIKKIKEFVYEVD